LTPFPLILRKMRTTSNGSSGGGNAENGGIGQEAFSFMTVDQHLLPIQLYGDVVHTCFESADSASCSFGRAVMLGEIFDPIERSDTS
jgi:hypothetical protein